jgi:hypothetical protein
MTSLRVLSLGVLLAFSLSAWGGTYSGTINAVSADNSVTGGWYFVYTGAISGSPSCATDGNRFVIDPTTPKGQAMIATVLAAFSLGKSVNIVGTGDCSVEGSDEALRYIIVNS